MDKNIQKIDKYLKNINLPEYESNQHRDTLRRQVINRTERITFMKNPITKFAVAAIIIIAVLIGIGHFGTNGSSLAWADIAERFESVPFFNLTIYLGDDTTTQSKKVEIWKSDDSRVRAYEENMVIFADFSNGKSDFLAFDKTTKEPVNTIGFVSIFLKDLYLDGRFSLDTIIRSFPSDSDIKSVKAADTAASKETVIFEIKHESTPEWLSIWALRESKLPVRMCFHDPRNNEFGDFIFNYSQKMEPSFFDPEFFKNQ